MIVRIYFFLFMMFLFCSCDKEENASQIFEFGREADFRVNTEYLSSDEELEFLISEINDSRCPHGVVCVWEGEATVKIEMLKPDVDSVLLSTYDKPANTTDNYKFELIEVLPYPDVEKELDKEDYVVRLKITKDH